MAVTDTIYALSTAQGRGGIAVIRVSGPDAFTSLAQISGNVLPPLRMGSLRKLIHPHTNQHIDNALVLRFENPHSFTGEDCVEYHVHGGQSVITVLLSALSHQPNHRLAMPGEFTRRAFENEKLDLTEAEAIADLIHAETDAQRLQALGQLSGTLSSLYKSWTDRLAHLLALMEADLDFSDQDLPDDMLLKVMPDITDLAGAIQLHLTDNRRGERLRDGFQLVVLGAPNAGKSSLINLLAQKDIAIVSPMAGTTRDILEAHLDIGGYPVIIADTAGLRPEQLSDTGQDSIESEGIRRALSRAREADLKILVFDGSVDADPHTLNLVDDNAIIVINKSDLGSGLQIAGVQISTLTGSGIDKLLAEIKTRLDHIAAPRETPSLTRARHREALERALDALTRSQQAPLPELAAEDMRLAIRYLGSITGRVDVEDLLDMIFRDFCIGK